MVKRSSKVGFLVFAILALLFILLVIWWWYRNTTATTGFSQTSSILATITSPINGDEVNAGDFVTVTGQAAAIESVNTTELFVDGLSIGTVSSSNPSWTWNAWPLGVHTFFMKATATNGQVGYSQVVIVNVLAGDGEIDAIAGESQTLEQIGLGYGVPADQMNSANPGLDPSQPLSVGKQVQVPIINKEPPTVPAGGGSLKLIPVKWKIKITEPVDKSYCYLSTGKSVWEKIPKDPFNYFFGQENFYTQLIPYENKLDIQAQCWGWAGGVLKYLGQGETFFDTVQPTNPVMISAEHFEFTGFPQLPDNTGGGPNGVVTPPYALREPGSASECSSHGNPLLAPLICDTLLNAKGKEYKVLMWEWKPEVCWPGYCKYEINEIDRYMVYELDSASPSSSHFLKEVDNPNQKVTAIPLPWGAACYGVTALSKGQESEMATYCPGLEPGVEKITLKAIQSWVTSSDALYSACNLVDIPRFGIVPKGFGGSTGQVVVGTDKFEKSGNPLAGNNCYSDAYINAGIKIQLAPALPAKSIIQKAVLRFSIPFQGYDDGLTASNKPLNGGTCMATVFRAKSDWSGLIDEDHWTTERLIEYGDFGGSISSVSPGGSPQVDVTAIVKGWVANPSSNQGFILAPVNHPAYFYNGLQYCYSGLSNFELDIYYIAPP